MKLIFTSLIILFCTPVFSQNMVPDSSFEVYNNCPTGSAQIQCPLNPWVTPQTLINWFSPMTTLPDFYNNCAFPNVSVHVPNSPNFGYIPPHTGNGFVGIFSLVIVPQTPTPLQSIRNYVECQLTQPMVAGQTYYISFWVRHLVSDYLFPAGANFVALDALEAHFSTTQVTNLFNSITLPGTPIQLPCQGFITDTTWVRIFGEYTATGGEQFMTLGTFNNGTFPPMQHVYPNPPLNTISTVSYYFIDDVSVGVTPFITSDTLIAIHDTTICTTHPVTLTAAAQTATSYTWNTGATTADLTVSTTGIFWRVATDGCSAQIDTFKVKLFDNTITRSHDSIICAGTGSVTLNSITGADSYQWNTGATIQNISVDENGTFFCTSVKNCILYTDTFHVTSFRTFTTLTDTAACFPTSITLTAESNADTYLWSTGATTASVSIAEPGSYNCEAIKGCDLYINNFTVNSNPAIESIDIGKDTLICKEERITIGHEYEGVSYLWNTGATTPSITPTYSGIYSIQVNDGCKILRDSVTIDMVACQDCFFVPTAFTPNADGKNDNIGVIAKCPLSSFNMIIVNRFGEVMIETSDLAERWDGHYKGEPCDLGTYYYMIQYTAAGNGQEHLLKGDITLIY